MTEEIVVYGAGGHGKAVAEILAASKRIVTGFIEDDLALTDSKIIGFPLCVVDEWLSSHSGASVALGIGDNRARERAGQLILRHSHKLISAVHPAAIVSRSARLGAGVVVIAGAVLNAECELEEGVIVNSGAIVEHDVRIGRYAHLSPGSAVGGAAQIGALSHIGMGAMILPSKRIGENCIIGAGAVVVEDTPDNQVAYGVPARIRRPNRE